MTLAYFYVRREVYDGAGRTIQKADRERYDFWEGQPMALAPRHLAHISFALASCAHTLHFAHRCIDTLGAARGLHFAWRLPQHCTAWVLLGLNMNLVGTPLIWR